jgi:integrase
MPDDPNPHPIPTLPRLIFGEAAPAALGLGSSRLAHWSLAFDAWLAERLRSGGKPYHQASLQTWTSLLRLLPKPPWEITPADLERFRDSLLEGGRAPATVRQDLVNIAGFYRWCGERCPDPGCPPSFNPALGVDHPPQVYYAHAQILTPPETEALLQVLEADPSLLSRRDHAFFLSRLRLGVDNKRLRELRWGQIEMLDGCPWVAWSPGKALPSGKALSPLPEQVWQAMLGYLHACGRLGPARPQGMPPEAFIFPPLAARFGRPATGQACEWNEGRPILRRKHLQILKIYGALVGIDEGRLTMQNLRYTAVARFLEASPSMEELDYFLGFPGREPAMQYRRFILGILSRQAPRHFEAVVPQAVRSRQPHELTPEDSFKHGLFTDYLPEDQLAAIMAEGITGMQEEIDGLKLLLEGLWDWYEKTYHLLKVNVLLGQVHSMATGRLEELEQFTQEEATWLSPQDAAALQEIQTYAAQFPEWNGWVPTYEDVMGWVAEAAAEAAAEAGSAAGVQAGEDLQATPQGIARNRLILRNLKQQAQATDNPLTYGHLVEHYCSSCNRLVKQLKKRRPAPGKIKALLEEALREARQATLEYWRSQPPPMVPGWDGPTPES